MSALVVPALLLAGCLDAGDTGSADVLDDSELDTAAAAATVLREPGIRVVVTVDWEGRDLSSANLAAIESFRSQFPDVPLVQFLNAAYYTKPGASASSVTRSIRRAVRTGDELGLHIHGWQKLFEASGVNFRSSPTFWGTELDDDCSYDCGHDVPISAYTATELRKVISFSVDKLQSNGLGRATSFRAGGWMANAAVRSALQSSGFVYEHSAVPYTYLAGELSGLPLLTWVRNLWSTTSSTQPYRITASGGSLVEIPDNGALADYVTASEMVAVFDSAVTAYLREPTKPRVVSIGFHQETATSYLSRVRSAITTIKSRARTAGVAVHFVTSTGAVAP